LLLILAWVTATELHDKVLIVEHCTDLSDKFVVYFAGMVLNLLPDLVDAETSED